MRQKTIQRKKLAAQAQPAPAPTHVVIDVAIKISAHITQHVAMRFDAGVPLAQWTRKELLAAAAEAGEMLPRKDALLIHSGAWSDHDHVLTVGVSGASDGDYPFLDMHVPGCPIEVFSRCFASSPVFYLSAVIRRGHAEGWTVAPAVEVRNGVHLARTVIRDEYPERAGNIEDVQTRLQRLDADRLNAIQAARKVAGLPRHQGGAR